MVKKIYYFYLVIFLSWILIGGECGTNNENYSFPPEPVAPPENIKLVVDAEPDGGESFAKISWTASLDENKSNFKGYRITTYILNSSDQVIDVFEVASVDKFINSYIVNNISRNVRYKSLVLSELTNGSQSAFRETPIYSGVYYNNDGSLNSYVDDNSLSGFGWDIQSGNGNQYLYTENNSSLIDLHLRENSGTLFFYSPNVFQNNFKLSKIDLVGSGQNAFDEINLSEPESTSIAVADESVYLLKTDEGFYIKIWVKDIVSIQNYFNVKFEYKVQPMEGLRILKR